jgi:hypothetical protein
MLTRFSPESLPMVIQAAIPMRLASVAALLVSASVIAEAASSGDTLVVVLQKQNGPRETHSQPIAADNCSFMLRLFKGLNEKGQSLTLNLGAPTQSMLKLFKEFNEKRQSLAVNLGAPTHGTADVLDIYCINANGEAVDWHGTALTAKQVQQRTDELISKGRK